MTKKVKNIVLSLVISIIITSIFIMLYAYPEYNKTTLQSEENQGISGNIDDPMANTNIFFFSIVSIAVFCICTLTFYFIIRYFEKRNN